MRLQAEPAVQAAEIQAWKTAWMAILPLAQYYVVVSNVHKYFSFESTTSDWKCCIISEILTWPYTALPPPALQVLSVHCSRGTGRIVTPF